MEGSRLLPFRSWVWRLKWPFLFLRLLSEAAAGNQGQFDPCSWLGPEYWNRLGRKRLERERRECIFVHRLVSVRWVLESATQGGPRRLGLLGAECLGTQIFVMRFLFEESLSVWALLSLCGSWLHAARLFASSFISKHCRVSTAWQALFCGWGYKDNKERSLLLRLWQLNREDWQENKWYTRCDGPYVG